MFSVHRYLLFFFLFFSYIVVFFFFFFNDTATTEIYTLSLHDALPIYIDLPASSSGPFRDRRASRCCGDRSSENRDRKSTRLNSSHGYISYAVFCLKKKKNTTKNKLAIN